MSTPSTSDETALWAWFLFRSGLPAQRAKALLAGWQERGLTLRDALAQPPRTAPGVTSQEAARLRPPRDLPAVTALCWDDEDYPAGLRALPLKLRPALLFYRGSPLLLTRPLVYLAPGELADDDAPMLHEAITLLVDEPLLLGVYEGSPQAAVLMEELAYSPGIALVFARSGIDVYRPSEAEDALIDEGRMIVVSPLPPDAAAQPAWDSLLHQIAAAAAPRTLLSGEAARAPAEPVPPSTLALTAVEPAQPVPAHVQVTGAPADVLLWVEPLLPEPVLAEGEETGETGAPGGAAEAEGEYEAGSVPTHTVPTEEDLTDEEMDLGPAPSADEILDTLSKGGHIPDALRRRLLERDEPEEA